MRSLPVKILALAALNLALLLAASVVFIWSQLDTGVESLLLAPVQPRLRLLANDIELLTASAPAAEREQILARLARQTGLELAIWENDGGPVAGTLPSLPEPFLRLMRTPVGAVPPPPPPPPGGGQKKKKKKGEGPMPVFLTVTRDAYWFGVRMPLRSLDSQGQPPLRATLVARAASLFGHPFLIDPRPWLVWSVVAAVITVLCWLPFIRNLARSVRRLRDGAERITAGHFDTRVPLDRRDEVGELGGALNRLGQQLGAFVHGQKRFLGDVAHELTAPLARAQMAVGILEERPGDARALRTVREEVDQISSLVNELLRFTRAGMATEPPERVAIVVGEVARRVIEREGAGADIRLVEGGDLPVLASREGLERALANLIRNAVRYAGDAGPVTIAARRDDAHVVITVADSGPGLPEDALDRVFAPFFRLDDARTRETGGTGLGLAIVKASIESSGGTVWCRNRSPRGLEVSVKLPAA